jgi:hypothetical protein
MTLIILILILIILIRFRRIGFDTLSDWRTAWTGQSGSVAERVGEKWPPQLAASASLPSLTYVKRSCRSFVLAAASAVSCLSGRQFTMATQDLPPTIRAPLPFAIRHSLLTNYL